ncbi:MAG: DNA polymerase Y family protein [Methylovirgula sp.]|nr:DNA polymerase Y family protein [Methylovirgula sp.]
MTRYLSLWLPSLATDRISRRDAAAREAPLATVVKVKSAQRLAAVNRAAAARGLRPGLALADARAILPDLHCCAADAAAEAATLANIADWCRRFTPLAALDAPDGAMLDITGAAHLFGGEAKLCEEIEARLEAQGFAARTAIAATPEAAWALARFGEARVMPEEASEEDLRRHLGALPLAALRLDEKMLAELAQAGLRRIGDLILRPRAPLAARFGKQLFVRLDALLGHAKTPITPRFEAPAYLAERRFAEPIVQRETIEATILGLARELSLLLARHGEGARQLDVSLFGVDGRVRHLRAGTSRPLRDPAVIARLFREKIEAAGNIDERDPLDAGFGFDLVRLSAEETERRDEEQAHWLALDHAAIGRNRPVADNVIDSKSMERAYCEKPASTFSQRALTAQDDLADLVDRLGARLGLRRVLRLDLADTHWPEFAVAAVPLYDHRSPHPEEPSKGRRLEGRGRPNGQACEDALHPSRRPLRGLLRMRATASGERELSPRPIRLLEKPEPIEAIASVPDGPPVRFRWRRVLHEVAAIEGPERIAPEWWKHDALTRDYFRAEDAEGRRFWLFREGLYETGTARPRWFLHGLFA